MTRRYQRWGSRSDRGSAEPLFILPIVFVMVVGVAQVGVWAHAQHRAQAIAAQTLAAARAFDGSTALAHERAEQAQTQLGGGMLRRVEVEVERTVDLASVQVTARSASLLPGVGLPVASELSGPVERLTP
ncbi:pilus assembly protein [Nocardiopsis sp. EMB25]|uniref:TadE/TadG family type IV pilus assembly protein n=1 Tax=Nocardiopsis sp. EMB25 TaxID=2835867 RepID=UPI0022841110|nr:TadE/TadG family type IV pilus assembly protein [Nocardiopsis sp. EMB25]MCY9785177.1 pilus assembly protein [Nocardiopsis sp. EMB25]